MPLPHQRRRGAAVLFRCKIPSDLRDRLGCGEIVRSLGRVTPGEARRITHHLWSQTEMAFMFVRRVPGMSREEIGRIVDATVADFRDITMFSSQDGTTVKSSINGSIEKLNHPSENHFVEKREERRLSALVGSTYPKLWPDPIRSGSYLEGFTPDNHAIVGELDMMPNVVVACGFSSHGFKMASAVGSALADLALDGKTNMPVAHLSTCRPMVAEFLSRSQDSPRAA